jgi:hypothetical protein
MKSLSIFSKGNLSLVLTFLFTATLLCSCASTKKQSQPKIVQKDYTSVPLYMAYSAIPQDSQEKYLYNPKIKVYSIGRRIDPATNILYEAGTVARIEQGPTWNLIPQHDTNPVTLVRKEYLDAYSNPLTGLVSTSINNSKAIQKSIKSTEEKVHYLTTSLNESKKLNKELATSLEKRTLENQKILENLKLMKQYIEKLEQNIDDLKLRQIRGN